MKEEFEKNYNPYKLGVRVLDTDYDILVTRTNNFTNRGIVFNGLTPYELYQNRCLLYDKYCDIKIKTNNSLEFLINMFRYLQ